LFEQMIIGAPVCTRA